MLRRLCLACVRWLVTPFSLRLAISASSAVCLATCCVQATALLGGSLPATLAFLATLVLGFAFGALPTPLGGRLRIPGITNSTLLCFALAAWVVISPSIVLLVDRLISRPRVFSLHSAAQNQMVLFLFSTILLGIPAFLVAKLAAESDGKKVSGRRPFTSTFLGSAAGLAVWGIGLGQVVGLYYCALIAAGLGLALSAMRGQLLATIARSEPPDQEAVEKIRADKPVGRCPPPPRQGDTPVDSKSLRPAAETIPVSEDFPGFPALWRLPVDGVLAIGLGGWLAAAGRLTEQLIPGTIYLACSEAIGLCLGIAAGWFLASRLAGKIIRLERARLAFAGGVALVGASLVAAFPVLFELSLWLHAHVSSTTLLIIARGVVAGICVLPAGAAAAVWMISPDRNGSPNRRLGVTTWLTLGMLGYSVASAWALRRFALEDVIVSWSWWIAAAAAPVAFARPAALFKGHSRKIVAGAMLLAIVVVPAWRRNFDLVYPAKLLFNGNAVYGYRLGLSVDSLIGIDEGRHVATRLGQHGIYTVWRFGGHQLQVRENGIPCDVVSTDVRSFPRSLPDVIQSVLPLALHGRPERMLQLGLGSGEGLSAALMFPLPEVVCIESDPGLVRVVREIVGAQAGASPVDDDRLLLAICEPVLGLAATEGRFDVIVSCPPNVALTRAQASFTAEFYRRAAAKLSPEGVFCQRLQHIDLGPRPIGAVIATLRSVFRDVIAIEVAAGDMVLAATNDRRGLIRPGLTARFELPHVRRVLAESGIDWPVALNLDSVNDARLGEFLAQAPQTASSAAGGRLSFSLPREVMRWGPKQQELFYALAPLKGRLLDWVGDEAQSQVLLRRLSEVQGQLDLMTKYSDQYWAYRATLRDQVKEKSRSKIQQVSAIEDREKFHPEDLRRLQYFNALGEATRTHSAADIDRMVRFAEPYDPLISYFVHEEAAEMYSRSSERNFIKELQHRLYATFFSSPRDASLRNVVGALKLLREHPEAEPDPAARWDDLNALLQALKLRWEARAGIPPTNVKEAINDIDTTVLAVEQTFRALERLTAEAGIPQSLWKARRNVLERTLLRPVKLHEVELLPHLNRRQPEGGAKRQAGAAPGGAEDGGLRIEDGG